MDRTLTDKPEESSSSGAQTQDQLLSGILASDLAVEISAEFYGRRDNGWDVPGATGFVLGKFHPALSSAKDGPVFLLALAALQIRSGHLQAVIRDAAADLIESGEALDAYRPDDFSQRKSVQAILEKFAVLLNESRVIED